jgi:ubiquinone/menaquinone biosynthesis C-methylase UbiE
MSIDDTRIAYDLDPEREWRRLESGAQARLEFIVTRFALDRHLPSPSPPFRILDAGGGPGRYTMTLAETGYRVSLLDLSPNLIELARKRIESLPRATQALIEEVTTGSITDLTRYADASFDVVLCLGGPLSHLINRSDRDQALKELRRVLKADGTLFVSVMGRIGAYRSAVQWIDWFDGAFPAVVDTGTTVISTSRVPTHFFYPEELVDHIETIGMRVEHMYGCQGIGAHLDEDNLLTLMNDPVRWPQWSRVLLETCDHPAVIGVSNHLLAVARRQ